MKPNVIFAIFRRNFISYFANPTGYVFICVFVLLSSIAAFWPNEFFNSNLANLDQLNIYLPYILLVFIPAITMSIWADERRQGTDELLLTIPAGDFDVVLGKYLAAVAIFTVALLFSMVSNLFVLTVLGQPDPGLFCATYFGYWVVGWAMLAIGMVASFLTGNLTVGFVLGALFNVPLAFAASADVIVKDSNWAVAIERWSISNQFRDFSRGVVSLSSVAYFLGIAVLMLYVSMVLIGRRHWRGGKDGRGTALHYLLRFLALLTVIVSVDVFLARHDGLRADVTSEGLSSLSPATIKLLKELNPKYPIQVFAYVSEDVPENYIQRKLDLLSTLSELKAAAGSKIDLDVRTIDPLSSDATQAEQQFGIRPRPVEARSRGTRNSEEIFLAVAVRCGLEKVVIPFIDKGLPVEYEVVRSIATVAQTKRKKVGVLTTDAKLFGGLDFQTMSNTPNQLVIEELQKQYDVVQVDPTNPIQEQYDVLLAVQPSSLGPQQMGHFIAAVKAGQPTAIFEDPLPVVAGDVPGTAAERQAPGGMNPFMGRQPAPPKGNIAPLWSMLGVNFDGKDVVWQNYCPYPEVEGIWPKEFVFAEEGVPREAEVFSQDDPISSRLQEVLFPCAGAIVGLQASAMKFTHLVDISGETGVVLADQVFERNPFSGEARRNPNLQILEQPTREKYCLAARISGKLKPESLMLADDDSSDEKSADDKPADSEPAGDDAAVAEPTADMPEDHDHAGHEHADHDHAAGEKPAGEKEAADKNLDKKTADAGPKFTPGEINAVIVGDIDCLYSVFFQLRSRGADNGDEIDFRFEDVTFVLNILDSLAGDNRFIDIRKHRPVHRTLTNVAAKTEVYLKKAKADDQKYIDEEKKDENEAQAAFDKKIAEVRAEFADDPRRQSQEIEAAQQQETKRLNAKLAELKQRRDKQFKATRRELAQTIKRVQDGYKLWGVLVPPIFPLLLGVFIYFNRRAREREGVAKTRLRS